MATGLLMSITKVILVRDPTIALAWHRVGQIM